MKISFVVIAIFLTIFSCDQRETNYKPPKIPNYYAAQFKSLRGNNVIADYVAESKRGRILIFNGNMCNLCQREKILSFSSQYDSLNRSLYVVVSNTQSQFVDFLKFLPSDSIRALRLSSEDSQTLGLTIADMTCLEFQNDSLLRYMKN